MLLTSAIVATALVGGTINMRWNLRFNPLVTVQSGAPFNLTTGQDNYGTTQFTARSPVESVVI